MGVLDSFYFCVVIHDDRSRDLAPRRSPERVFTVFYIFIGLGFVMAFVTAIIQRSRCGR
jgi:hypothetical protein